MNTRIWIDAIYWLLVGISGVLLFVIAVKAGTRIGLWLGGSI